MTLCAIFLTHTADSHVQWVAGILLKNTLKDHLGELKARDPAEVEAIERALFIVLATGQFQEVLLSTKKVQEEYYMITSQVIIKEFCSDQQDTQLFNEVVGIYQRGYN